MNRELVFEQHIIEAWGLWWVQWQNDMKARLRSSVVPQTSMSTRVNTFADLHLQTDIEPQEKVLGGTP